MLTKNEKGDILYLVLKGDKKMFRLINNNNNNNSNAYNMGFIFVVEKF